MERPPNRSHGGATGFSAPLGITLTYAPESTTLAEMLLAGELDATLSNLAVPNLVDRGSIDVRQRPEVRPLFNTAAESVRYYRKTGIFPFNHSVVIRRKLVEAHPWLPQAVFRCFVHAKELATQDVRDNLAPYAATGLITGDVTANDPVPYGLAANRVAIETLNGYLYEQGLTSRLIAPGEVFANLNQELDTPAPAR
jgi:4,5-dihydroxyphthalate decarboxylase